MNPLLLIATILTVEFVGGLLMYYGLSWLSYRYFFVWKKSVYFPTEPEPDRAEIRKAQKLALWGTAGNAVLALPFHYLTFTGRSKIYTNISDHSWGYYVFTILFFLAFTETFVYWAHRFLHHPFFYKHLHSYHHAFRKTTPWVSMAFHPLDSFAQAFPHYLCALILPVHVSVYAFFILFVMVWTFLIHDRVSLVRLGIVNYTAHHTLHHLYNKYNLGQFLTIWDRLGGTYRNPKTDTKFPDALIPPQVVAMAPVGDLDRAAS